MGEPEVADSEPPRVVATDRRSWAGPALLLAVALRITGLFLRYESFRLGEPNAKPHWFTLYDGLGGGGGRAIYFLSLALTAALGIAIVVRPNLVRAALVGGFCITTTVAAAYAAFFATGRHPTVDLGPGFFTIYAGLALEAVVAARMLFVVASASDARSPASSRNTGLAVVAAVVVGVSSSMLPVLFRAQALFAFAPLSLRSGAAAAVAFIALAMVPLLAARVRGPAGSALLVGLAASLTISLANALNERYRLSASSFFHITIGFWLDVVAIGLLLLLAARFAAKRETQPDVSVSESATLPI